MRRLLRDIAEGRASGDTTPWRMRASCAASKTSTRRRRG